MSLNRASNPTSTTRIGVHEDGLFAKDYDKDTGVVGTAESLNGSANQAFLWKQWQDPMEGNVSIAAANQPFVCMPSKSVRSSSTAQGRVRDGGHEDLATPAATRSSLRTPSSRNSERHTSTASSFFSSSILTSICGYFATTKSLFSSGEDTDVATKKKHVRFSLINDSKTPAARRLSFLLDGEEVPAQPKHRRSPAHMLMNDILFELDINDFSLETPTDVPTFIVFERKKSKCSSRRRYASQLFFSPQQSRRRPSKCMRVNQSF